MVSIVSVIASPSDLPPVASSRILSCRRRGSYRRLRLSGRVLPSWPTLVLVLSLLSGITFIHYIPVHNMRSSLVTYQEYCLTNILE